MKMSVAFFLIGMSCGPAISLSRATDRQVLMAEPSVIVGMVVGTSSVRDNMLPNQPLGLAEIRIDEIIDPKRVDLKVGDVVKAWVRLINASRYGTADAPERFEARSGSIFLSFHGAHLTNEELQNALFGKTLIFGIVPYRDSVGAATAYPWPMSQSAWVRECRSTNGQCTADPPN